MRSRAAPSPDPGSARRLAYLLLLVTLGAYALWAASAQVTGADLWWQMATGRYIVEHGDIPRHDVFSYTAEGAPWVNGEWLSQVLYYELYRHGGGTAVACLKLAVTSAIFFLAAWVAWRRSGSGVFAVAAAVVGAVLCRSYLDTRPQLFLFLGTLVVMAIVDAYRRGARPAILILLPLTMALWVNLHFSFVFGLAVLGLYAGGEIVKAALHLPAEPMPMPRALRLAAAVAAAALACLVNPLGVEAVIFPFTMLGADDLWRQEIIEWRRTVLFVEEPFNPALFGYVLCGQLLAAVGAFAGRRRRFDLCSAALVAVTGAMALTARRFIPLFAIVSVPFLATNLALVRDRLRPRAAGAPELADRRAAAGVALACVLALALLARRALPEVRATYAPGLFEGMIYAGFFPRGAVDFLRDNPLPGRVFHIYTWGGYLMYHLPERKVFIDGRANTVYSAAFYRDNVTAERGAPGWSDVLDRYQVGLVLWPSGFAGGGHLEMLRALRNSPSWQCVYDDNHSAVFAHVDRGRAWIEQYRAFGLRYPDLPRAQLFLANAYLEGNQFERARRHLVDLVQRVAGIDAVCKEAAQHLLEGARSTNQPQAWFGVGFYRDVAGDTTGAAAAYRTALEGGLAGPPADYTREAIARLSGAR